MAGRRPTPTPFKLVTGNPGKRPLNSKEPKPKEGYPDIPQHFNEQAKDIYLWLCDMLNDMGLLTVVDGIAIERLTKCYIEILECDKVIEEHGQVQQVVNTQGELVLKSNPAVAQRADADRRLRAWMIEYGLTQASRSKVKVNGKEEANELDQFFG
ncbi:MULTISPECIES: phage terminase small subunit P27 family [Gilliamella]|uniref:phage terminase small subunit P27 family n=1 Tax=Gilliamella TaxID=1193503 RepID=UPI000A16AEEB|nr:MULTISPECIES: phage terminase small subunit P27 family [Gilliamella]MWP47453.1 phage terminase small subunit P27 family [Gilliamella sp. Pas-s27]NUF26896.1 phage terminase small subunit P27 family [Gilliamella sp. ESL0254]NUF50482.1 phage terminase small subunit P27 family [Gilliamella sp. ESL0250]